MKVSIVLLAIGVYSCAPTARVAPETAQHAKTESPGSPEINTKALQHFLDGEMLMLEGNYAMAVLEFQDALLYDPSSTAILTSMANGYLRLGKFSRAESFLQEALSFEPKNREARELLGHHYLVMGRLDDAEKHYGLLKEFFPAVSDYRYILAEIALRKGDPESAQQQLWDLFSDDSRELQALQRAAEIARERNDLSFAFEAYQALIEADPANVQFWRVYSELAILLRKFDEAISGLERLVELTTDDPGILERLAILHYENSGPERAQQILEDLYAQDYHSVQVLYFLGRMALERDDHEAAAEYSLKLMEDHPGEVAGYTNLALAYISLDRTLDAISILLKARDRFPENFAVNFLLGNSYSLQENYLLARKSLISALEIVPDSRSAKHLLATVYNHLDEWGLSVEMYEELLDSDSEDSQALNNYSYTLVERGMNLERALQMAKRAIELEPENAAYLDTIGWVYFKLGRVDKAVEYIGKSLEIEAGNPVVLEHMGDVLSAAEKRDEAGEFYRKALELDPDNEMLHRKAKD